MNHKGALFLFVLLFSWPAFAGWLDVRHIVRTNDVLDVTHGEETERAYQAENWTFELYAVSGTNAVDLSATNLYCCWYLVNPTNSTLFHVIRTGTIVNATSGHVSFYIPPPDSNIQPLRYRSLVRAYQPVDGTNAYIGTLDERYWTVRAAEDSAEFDAVPPVPSGATWGYISGNISNQTDLLALLAAIPASTTNAGIPDAPSNGTAYARQDGAWVEVPTNTGSSSTGGGTTLRKSGIDLLGTYSLGDGLTVEGSTIDVIPSDVAGFPVFGTAAEGKAPVYKPVPYTNGVWTYVPWFDTLPTTGQPLTVWWHPDVQQWALDQPYAYSQQPLDTNVSVIRTNVAVFRFSGETNSFVVPPGVSNLLVKLWGSAGANGSTASRGGSGGYASGYLAVTPGETLNIVVGGGVGYNHTNGAFGGGGYTRSSSGGGGGGGAYILRGTNLCAAAGAGGGGAAANYGGAGGGSVGGNASTTAYGGYGGSQTNGGYSGGSYMHGGDGSGAYSGGGGGGYYGGGGSTAGSYQAGGGGSSYIALLQYAVTYSVNFSYDDDYEAGVGAVSASTYSHGGPGLVVIRW